MSIIEGLEPALDDMLVGQWRLEHVQLYNWGTFQGLHRLGIARKGHLITGPSGSGKSSLLDAIATVLTPDRWLRLNDAAQAASHRGADRTKVSYVRGAWTKVADAERDRVVSRYLRPRVTSSGILLRFHDGGESTVTLARLFFMPGTKTDAGDLRDVCLVERSALELADVMPFVRDGVDARSLKAARPSATVSTRAGHAAFYTRALQVLGITSLGALQLLHKTQSAKNLGGLDQLFRTFMLDEPETFRRAATALEQFGELSTAHDLVVEARAQRDALRVLQAAGHDYAMAMQQASEARRLLDALDPFRARLGAQLARRDLEAARSEAGRHAEAAAVAARQADEAREAWMAAHARLQQSGGADVSQLSARIDAARAQVDDTDRRWRRLRDDLAAVGIAAPPNSAAELAELHASAVRERDDRPTAGDFDVTARFFEARRALQRIDEQLHALRLGRSNLSPQLQVVRRRLAEHLGVTEAAIPFAGELLEVLPEHERWTGAIERVLRPLSTSLLVRAEHLGQVRRWVDGEHLGDRLVLTVVPHDTPPPRAVRSATSLAHRVRIEPGGFHDWLASRLSHRFDVACVEHADELDDHERAVTIRGQLKSSSERYEKDDRTRLDDRRHWVLGGSNEAKVELLVAERKSTQREHDEAEAALERYQRQRDAVAGRQAILRSIASIAWHEVDTGAAEAEVVRLEAQREALTTGNADLRAATDAEQRATATLREADVEHREVEQQRRAASAAVEEAARALADYEARVAASPPLDTSDVEALEERFRARRRTLTRETLADVHTQVQASLFDEEKRALSDADTAAQLFVRDAAVFRERWPAAAADLSTSVTDHLAYGSLLEDIESRGLPEHERSFLRLLREKSANVIGYLRKDLLDAPGEVHERIEPVNASLSRSEFDRDRFLRIRVKTHRGALVEQFLADLKTIAEGSWDDGDLASAERRFVVLQGLMRRLASSERADEQWRVECLDTRRHVVFLAEVLDRAGQVRATYDSGAALSGGQQQKLVVFCLAAALRYQLTEADGAVPRYGTVVLDEAFDKADSRYTRMAMDVFVEFGFQMVLATPQKLVQTIEPYVGAVTAVSNPDEQASQLANVAFEP